MELPTAKADRAKFYQSLTTYYKDAKIDVDPEDLKDTGDTFISVGYQ